MPGKSISNDLQEMIAEVAKRHGIILAPDDAIFAVVTLNELVMKKTVQDVASTMAATVDRLQSSIQRAEMRAGQVFVQQARDSVQEFRTGLLQELAGARIELNRSLRFWTYAAFLCAALFCIVGFWLGRLTVLR